jgi:phage FluMu protein Com
MAVEAAKGVNMAYTMLCQYCHALAVVAFNRTWHRQCPHCKRINKPEVR